MNTTGIQIRFWHIQFTELDLKAKTFEQEVTSELTTSLEISSMFTEENKKSFAIVFQIGLKNKQFNLKIKAVAHFSTDQDVNKDFAESPFVKINAPAIAFPYVSTFISNLTLNSGFHPVVLPAFNFVKLAEDKEKKRE